MSFDERAEGLADSEIVIFMVGAGVEAANRVSEIRALAPEAKVIMAYPRRKAQRRATMQHATNLDGAITQGDGIWRAIGEIEGIAFSRRRWARRFEVSVGASVEGEGLKATGRLRDIAAGGALIVLPLRLQENLESGSALKLRVKSPEDKMPISCSTVVRRIANRRTLWGRKLAVGLEFQSLDRDTKDALDRLTDWLVDAEKIKQVAAELVSGATGHRR